MSKSVELPDGHTLVEIVKYVGVYNIGERAHFPHEKAMELLKLGAVKFLDASILKGNDTSAEDEETEALGAALSEAELAVQALSTG